MTDFPCDFRGEILRTEQCQLCSRREEIVDVYACSLLGECTVKAANLRAGGKRTGAKVAVCLRCDSRTVEGEKAEPLGAVEIQQVRRTTEQTQHTPCALQLTLGARVRQERENHGLTVADAATAAGCNAALWERIESGEHWPGAERLERIAGALNVPPSALL